MSLYKVAQEARKSPTRGERALWDALRGRQLGVKFRRQCVIPPFMADFACFFPKVIVEVDGPHHAGQREADLHRQRVLEERGFRFVRVSADEAEQRTEEVLERIRSVLSALDAPRTRDASQVTTALPRCRRG